MTNEAVDPTRHLISNQEHFWDAQDQPAKKPVPFADEAEQCRRSLTEADASSDSRTTITGAEALVSASLLTEFAARLRQDIQSGAVTAEGEHLASLADDVATRMRAAGGLDL